LAGQPDPRIAAVCQAESCALVTLDLDFADIRRFPSQDYHGIIGDAQETVLIHNMILSAWTGFARAVHDDN
jgi:hypothetical protein